MLIGLFTGFAISGVFYGVILYRANRARDRIMRLNNRIIENDKNRIAELKQKIEILKKYKEIDNEKSPDLDDVLDELQGEQ